MADHSTADLNLPFRNTDLPLAERIRDLVSRLTFDEKVSLLGESAPDIPRLGIRRYYHGNEALHGIVRPGKFTVFPRPVGLASTFHPELIEQMADAASDEARARYNEFGGDMRGDSLGGKYNGLLTFWSPNVNLARDPRWGRTSETYGEDPCLTAAMGAAFVRGLQGRHPRYIKAVATPKHFAANNEEHNRFECKAEIPERVLREYYLQSFRGTVENGHAESVMTAYNAINGVPCTANRMLLTEILRDEWGFDGYVVGDMWSPTFVRDRHHYTETWEQTAAVCIRAGLDLDSGIHPFLHLRGAIEQGLCSESDVDRALGRILRARFRLGLFDPEECVPFSGIGTDVIGCEKHQAIALELARESLVLLKNDPAADGKKLLPLDRARVKSIAVLGPTMHTWRYRQYSAEGGSPNAEITPLDGLRSAARGIDVRHIEWAQCDVDRQMVLVPADCLRPSASAAASSRGLSGEYFRNQTLSGTPAAKRIDAEIDFNRTGKAPDELFADAPLSVRWTGQLVPPVDGDYTIAVTADDGVRLWLDGKLVVDAWKQGSAEHRTAATFRAGRPVDIRIEYFDAGGEAVAKLSWITPRRELAASDDPALQLAASSDVVIAFMGIDENRGGEGHDTPSLDLPPGHTDFLRRVHAVNPNIVLVLLNGTCLRVAWEKDHVPAILEAWLPGERAGQAIAEVLFGDYNPAGRLSMTFYDGERQLPPFGDYDITKGRTYMYLRKRPLFAFGHGLSYTTFEYANLRCEVAGGDQKCCCAKPLEVTATDSLIITADIRNTGGRDGDEVVQLYVRNVESPLVQPIRQLKGFKRVHIPAGQTAAVRIPLRVADLAHWDDRTHTWTVEPGVFELQLAAASDDVRLTSTLNVVLGTTAS